MTVKELIEKLKELPQDFPVRILTGYGYWPLVIDARIDDAQDTVILDGDE